MCISDCILDCISVCVSCCRSDLRADLISSSLPDDIAMYPLLKPFIIVTSCPQRLKYIQCIDTCM